MLRIQNKTSGPVGVKKKDGIKMPLRKMGSTIVVDEADMDMGHVNRMKELGMITVANLPNPPKTTSVKRRSAPAATSAGTGDKDKKPGAEIKSEGARKGKS